MPPFLKCRIIGNRTLKFNYILTIQQN